MGLGTFFSKLFGKRKNETIISVEDAIIKFKKAQENLLNLQKEMEDYSKLEKDPIILNKLLLRIKLLNNVNTNIKNIGIRKGILPNDVGSTQDIIKKEIDNDIANESDKILKLYDPSVDGLKFEARVFFRKDLRDVYKDMKFEEIDYYSLLVSSEQTLRKGTLLMFVDKNGETKILKNRYGKMGIVK